MEKSENILFVNHKLVVLYVHIIDPQLEPYQTYLDEFSTSLVQPLNMDEFYGMQFKWQRVEIFIPVIPSPYHTQ
jgi:hypothetical protein